MTLQEQQCTRLAAAVTAFEQSGIHLFLFSFLFILFNVPLERERESDYEGMCCV